MVKRTDAREKRIYPDAPTVKPRPTEPMKTDAPHHVLMTVPTMGQNPMFQPPIR